MIKMRCKIFNHPDRPATCHKYKAEIEFCGNTREEAFKILEELEEGEEVFGKRTSIVFKRLHVVRFLDKKRNVLVYLAYSDKVIEGSPKNSISTVPIMPWRQE